MKKNIVIVVLFVAVISASVLAYSAFNQVSDYNDQIQTLKSDLIKADKNLEELEVSMTEVEKVLSDKDVVIEGLEKEIKAQSDELIAIDKQLQAGGKVTEKIERLMTENRQWKEELNNLAKDLDELEIQVTDSTQSSEVTIEAIDDVIVFVEDRKALLEETVANLPAISLERIMINQEIEFFEETIVQLEAIKETL